MKAIEICLNTKKLLEQEKEIYGVVHSVFNKVCNIETQDKILIPLIAKSIPNMPRCISLQVSQDMSMFSLGLEKGKKVIFKRDLLKTSDAGFQLQLGNAATWDGRPKFLHMDLEEKEMLNNLHIMKNVLMIDGKLDGLAPILMQADKLLNLMDGVEELPMNQYCSFIWPRFSKLIQWILNRNLLEIQNSAKQIIGFGLGLTPSADDVLTGIMIAMIYGAHYYGLEKEDIYQINHAIVEGVELRTTKVSAEMLSFASKGEVAENIRQLVISIFAEADRNTFVERIRSVVNNGETSGSDCITGIYIGCLMSTITNNERKMKR